MKQIKILESEEGFAPLIVTVIIVIILSLLTIGFVDLMRNNQYNALNKQLNNDAYYAAESGVNDAVEALQHGYNQTKSQCAPLVSNVAVPGSQYLDNNVVNGSQDVYSCLLINPTPANLQYSSIDTNSPTVAIITGDDPSTGSNVQIGYLKFSWQPAASVSSSPYSFASPNWLNVGSGPYLPPQNQWPYTGILRLALTPVNFPSNTIPSDTSNTYTSFLYPISGNGSPGYDSYRANQNVGEGSGDVVGGNCVNNNNNEPDTCNVIIDLRSSNANSYIMALRSIYAPTMVTITAYNASGTAPQDVINIKNAQTLIDSTGNDHGVLKRIQVRVPKLNYTGMPPYDFESAQAICSDLNVYPHNQATNTQGYASSSCGL